MNNQIINNMSARKLELFQNNALKFINTEVTDQQYPVPFYFKVKPKLKLPSLQVSRIMIGNIINNTESYCSNKQFGRRRILESPNPSQPLLLIPDLQIESELKRRIKQKCLLKNAHRIQFIHKQK